jgi:hypothetical protein
MVVACGQQRDHWPIATKNCAKPLKNRPIFLSALPANVACRAFLHLRWAQIPVIPQTLINNNYRCYSYM